MNRFHHFLAATIAAITIMTNPCAAQADAPSAEEVRAVAEEAYTYGLPLVMARTASYGFWLDKSSPQYKSPLGELVHTTDLASAARAGTGGIEVGDHEGAGCASKNEPTTARVWQFSSRRSIIGPARGVA